MQQDPQSSTSGGRQLRERKKRRYDVDLDISSDDEPQNPKRATRRKSAGPPSMKRPKRSGKLASFVNMPLDVLHEIFGHLHPYDLLKLTRTTKDFRRILLHKSSISTWRTSFEDVPNLPDCPSDLSEPAWANLAFSPHCHYCLATGIRNVEWKFRVRVCSKCTPVRLIETNEFGGTLADLYGSIPGGLRGLNVVINGLAELCSLVPNRGGKRYKRVFLVAQLVAFRDELHSFETQEDKQAYIASRRKWIADDLNIHAANSEAWAHNQADDRFDELAKLRKERRDAIVKKLEELGYKKDVQFLKLGELDKESFVNKPQRLTDRIWKNVKPVAIKFIDQVRERRLKDEYENLVLVRKRYAAEFLRNYKNNHLPCTDIYPEPPDFCNFDPVRRILTRPADVIVDVATFDCLLDAIPDLLKRWREEVHSGIRNVLLTSMTATFAPGQFNLPEWTNNASALRHKMSLATTVFVCGVCNGPGQNRDLNPLDIFGIPFGEYDEEDEYYDFEDASERFLVPLFYPQVMAHPCLTRFSLRNEYLYLHLMSFGARKDPSTFLEDCLKQRQKWKSDHLRLDKLAAKVAEQVVALAGLDPATTTTAEMDRLDARFKCEACRPHLHTVTPPPRSHSSEDGMVDDGLDGEHSSSHQRMFTVLSWRLAVKHQLDRHVQGINPSDMMAPVALRQPRIDLSNLKLMSPTDPIAAEARDHEKAFEHDAEIWCCAHCRDLPQEHDVPITMHKLRDHLRGRHKLDAPVLNTDYYKHFAAADLINVSV